jgi:hypothetical protein
MGRLESWKDIGMVEGVTGVMCGGGALRDLGI